MVTPLGPLVQRALNRAGIRMHVEAAQILEAAERQLATVLGPERAVAYRPTSYRQAVLTITATSPTAASELRIHESELRRRLQQLFPELPIDRLDIRVRASGR